MEIIQSYYWQVLILIIKRTELAQSESELLVNRLRAEEATSRDNLAKLSALNEGLAADKVELHRTIAHLEEKLQVNLKLKFKHKL